MQKILSVLLIPVLLLGTIGCPKPAPTTIQTYVDLAVTATVNGLKLAQAFGSAQVTDALIKEVSDDGALLESTYADWVAADPTSKATAWGKVQAALDVFKARLPEILNAIHVTNPVYGTIAALAIQAVETVVSAILAQNPNVTKVKSAPKFDVDKFKSDYNQKMVSANHPELQLK